MTIRRTIGRADRRRAGGLRAWAWLALGACALGHGGARAAAPPSVPAAHTSAHDAAEPPPAPPTADLAPLRPYRHFTRQQGLPQNSISAMIEDADGVLWLGTLDGLASFDGSRITDAGAQSGTPPLGAVLALGARSLGGIYVGTNAGLYLRTPEAGWRYLGDQRSIASLVEAEPGTVWAVDQQGRLSQVTDDGAAIWQVVPLAADLGPALAVGRGSDGRIWVATHHALLQVDADGTPQPVVRVAPPDVLTTLLVDRAGHPWIGTAGGQVARFARGPGLEAAHRACPASVAVTALADDWRGRVWAGCADGHLSVGTATGDRSMWGADEGLRLGARINALASDRHGHVWIGRNGLGAMQLVSERWRHRTHWSGTERHVPGEGIMGVSLVPGGGALVGVFSRGVWRWDGTRVTELGAAAGLTENTRSVAEPQPGVIWVGGRLGLYESVRGSPFRKLLSVPVGFVNAIVRGPDGTWYALTQVAGLFSRRNDTWVPERAINAQLPHQNLRGATWLRNGDLWLATAAGIAVVRNGQVSVADVRINDQPFVANAILELPNGEVWVGALGGLLIRRGDTWRLLGPDAGLPGRSIYALAPGSDGSVWVGGSAGVGRYQNGQWEVFDRHSGLVEDECTLGSIAVLPDGRVLAGTMGSLAVYDPSEPSPPAAPLRVRWLSTPARDTDGVARLAKGARDARLAWSAPWLSPDPVEYRVRTDPGASAFSEPSTRTDLYLARLDPGRWTVQVQARIGGARPGPWTDPIAIVLDVQPYFYETWWARLLGVLLVGALVPLGIKLRTAQLERRERALERAVEAALSDVKMLTGLIPICASCKRIRDDRGAWNQLEAYLNAHSDATLSHGICPDCMTRLYPDYTDRG